MLRAAAASRPRRHSSIAASAYSRQQPVGSGEVVAIYDFGGGTFDVSLLEIGDGVFEVKSTSGDTFLGGEDFDAKLVEFLSADFKKAEGIDLTKDKLALQRLKEGAEKAKIELSSSASTEVNLPFITADATGPKHLVKAITRADLEKLVIDLIEKTRKPCIDAMNEAGVKADAIDEIILVGGMSRMPRVRQFVKELFGKEANAKLKVIECAADGVNNQKALCDSKNLEGFPTWEINGKLDSGVKTLAKLAELSGFKGQL